MTTPLPVTIDATYADTGTADVKEHQQHHDVLHAAHNKTRVNAILPETYGATGNARQFFDAAMTSGSAVLTSAAGAVFTASDVGRTVQVMGAGASGVPLVTTVSTFTSATSVTLAATAGTTVTGQTAVLGTNDQTALQTCLDALKFGDRMYLDPNKTYLHTAVLNVNVNGTGVMGRGTLQGTDQNQNTLRILASDVTLLEFTKRVNAGQRQLNGQSAGVWAGKDRPTADQVKRLTIRDVKIDGSGSAGFLIYGVEEYLIEDCLVQYSKADGFHNTYGARDGTIKRPIARYVGDDGVAVVSYEGDGLICRDITVTGAKCLGETGGRGMSVVGGEDITYLDSYVERSTASGIIVAVEKAYTTYPTRRVRVIGATLIECCQNGQQSFMGVVHVSNDRSGEAYALEDVRIEAIRDLDSPQNNWDHTVVISQTGTGEPTPGIIRRVHLSQFEIVGGAFSALNGSIPAGQVNRVNWVQDGRLLADILNWGGFTGRAWSDANRGRYHTVAAVKGAVDLGIEPKTLEYLTTRHTTRGTVAMIAGTSGWVWFSRVEITKRGTSSPIGQGFDRAGVANTVAQAGGSTETRVGLYADDGTGSRPGGAPVFDWGAVTALTTAAGDRLATLTNVVVDPGVWWVAFAYREITAPTTRPTLVTATGMNQLPGTTLGTALPGMGWHQTGWTGGALPTVGTLVRDAYSMLTGLRAT